jgi:hypothetical protein
MADEKEGRFLGTVEFRQGQDFNGNVTTPLAAFTTNPDGVAALNMQIGLAGHRTPANVIEGRRADEIAAALDRGDTARAKELAGISKHPETTARHVGDILARGDRAKYNGSHGKNLTVTILATNVGEVGRFKVADSKGNSWHTRAKNLSR